MPGQNVIFVLTVVEVRLEGRRIKKEFLTEGGDGHGDYDLASSQSHVAEVHM